MKIDIKTDADACALIDAIAAWLASNKEKCSESYHALAVPFPEGRLATVLARRWSHRLLESAKCNDYCGCRLCQG